jgi:hypothetical protein
VQKRPLLLLHDTLATQERHVRSEVYVNGAASSSPAPHVVTLTHCVWPDDVVMVGTDPSHGAIFAQSICAPVESCSVTARPYTLRAPTRFSKESLTPLGVRDTVGRGPCRSPRSPHGIVELALQT